MFVAVYFHECVFPSTQKKLDIFCVVAHRNYRGLVRFLNRVPACILYIYISLARRIITPLSDFFRVRVSSRSTRAANISVGRAANNESWIIIVLIGPRGPRGVILHPDSRRFGTNCYFAYRMRGLIRRVIAATKWITNQEP